jgi:hypothetical protein
MPEGVIPERHPAVLPPLFYITFGLQASFLAYAAARLLRGREGSDFGGEHRRLIVTEFSLVADLAVSSTLRARRARAQSAPARSCGTDQRA